MPFNEKIKNVLSFLGRVGLSIFLLVYLFQKIDLTKTKEVLMSSNLVYIFYAGILFLIINGLLLLRWFVFIKAMELQVPILSVVRYFFIGLFGNLFLPSSMGGDLMRILGLCRASQQKTRVVASVLLDRLSGFVSIVLVAIVALILGYQQMDEQFLIIPIILVTLFFVVFIAVLFNERAFLWGCRLFDRLPKVKKNLMEMHYDIALLKSRQNYAFQGLLLSCVSQVIFACFFYFIARGLHQDTALIYFLIFVPFICIAASFPSIGGLGVREAGTAYLFSRVGMDAGIAVSISLINFLFMVIIGLVGGFVYVVTFSSGRIQHHSSNAV